mgnify:CR=1 FL=1
MIHRLACFGVPSVFSFKSAHCGRCQSFEECRKSSYEELKSAALDSDVVRFALIEHERIEHDVGAPANRSWATLTVASAVKPHCRSYALKRPRYGLTDAQARIVATVPKNAAIRLVKLFKSGDDVLVRRALLRGDRHFTEISNQRSLVLCLRTLSRELLVTRRTLKAGFMSELGWANTSAQSETTIMWNVLPGLGVAYREGEALLLAPEFIADNNPIQTRVNNEHKS